MAADNAVEVAILEETFTAHELAVKLSGLRRGFNVKTRQVSVAYSALGSILRGYFTAEGAREEARRAYEKMLNLRGV